MKILTAILTLCLSLISLLSSGQEDVRGDDIRKAVSDRGQAEVEIAYPGFKEMSSIAGRFSVSSCDGQKAVIVLSGLDAEEFIRTAIPYKTVTLPSPKAVYTASDVEEAMQWHSYPTWQQYDTIMHLLATTYPDVCVIDTIGYSVLGRAILALKISDNPGADEQEPAVLLTSTMHGDELGGFVLMMRLAEFLSLNASDGALVQQLTSGLEIWINPLSNPDGTYRTDDTIKFPTRANYNGYDLNRNFPDPGVTYPPPLQPENAAMISFLRENRFSLSANFHGGAEIVNYPWDRWLDKFHPDDGWFYSISRRYADTVHLYSGPGYMNAYDNGVVRGAVWYVVQGGRQDFVTWELGGREITIELDLAKQTPATDLETLWSYNKRSFLKLLQEALFGVHGRVTAAADGVPLEAKVFIRNHDSDSSHIYTMLPAGTFYRYLAPGSWDLTVSCPGYKTYTTNDVSVTAGEMTWLDIELGLPDLYPPAPVKGLLIYPSPASGEVRFIAPEVISGNVMVTIVNLSGATTDSYTVLTEAGEPVKHNFSAYAQGIYIVTMKKLPSGPRAMGKVVVTPCVK